MGLVYSIKQARGHLFSVIFSLIPIPVPDWARFDLGGKFSKCV